MVPPGLFASHNDIDVSRKLFQSIEIVEPTRREPAAECRGVDVYMSYGKRAPCVYEASLEELYILDPNTYFEQTETSTL